MSGRGSGSDDEVVLTLYPISHILDGHHQAGIKNRVGIVGLHAGEEDLGGQQGAVRGLHLNVNVFGAPGIQAGDDGYQLVSSGGIGILVTAQGISAVVIISTAVGLPEIEQGMHDRLASGVEHVAAEDQLCASHAGLEQVSSLG